MQTHYNFSFEFKRPPRKFNRTFVEATAYEDLTVPLDFAGGRAQLISGTIYYSPNCTRTVALPLSPRDDTFVRTRSAHSIEELHRPFLWSSGTAHLAFVPLNPDFDSVPFNDLLDFPSHFDNTQRRQFTMGVPRIIQWAKLEMDVHHIADELHQHYDIPQSLHIVSPSILTCGGHFDRPEDLQREEESSNTLRAGSC